MIMMTAISPGDVATTQSHTTVHLVTEKELSQYEEYVISKFDPLRSYMVVFIINTIAYIATNLYMG